MGTAVSPLADGVSLLAPVNSQLGNEVPLLSDIGPPTQLEVQTVVDKINELMTFLRLAV